MCGICGFVGKVESQGIVLESMMQELYHCEEDDLGEYYWENGAMAFRQGAISHGSATTEGWLWYVTV